jgi:DNA-binding MarR family transcriptional regulator
MSKYDEELFGDSSLYRDEEVDKKNIKDIFKRGAITHRTTYSDEYEVFELILRLNRLFFAELKDLGIKYGEYMILTRILRTPGITLSNLSANLAKEKCLVKVYINKLVQKDLISREVRQFDERLKKFRKAGNKYIFNVRPKGIIVVRKLTQRLIKTFDSYTLKDRELIIFLLNTAIENNIATKI